MQADGAVRTLTESKTSDGTSNRTVAFEEADGTRTEYLVRMRHDGAMERKVTQPDGSTNTSVQYENGDVETTLADGTQTTSQASGDPRFGFLTPYRSYVETRTPGGLKQVVTGSQSAQGLEGDPILANLVETTTVNGRTYEQHFDATSFERTAVSPEGRMRVTAIDEAGRPVRQATPGLAATELTYDGYGRLSETRQVAPEETRVTSFDYDSLGRVSRIIDPLGRQVRFGYDAVDRLTEQTLPDGRKVFYEYDANGNLTAVTPPERPRHAFGFSPVDQTTAYDAPNLTGTDGVTHYEYNLAKQLVAVNRPDGVTVDYFYEGDPEVGGPNTGRLKKIVQPRGETTVSYDSAGRPSTLAAPDGGTLAYEYDGSLVRSTSWEGEVAGKVSQTYDNNFWVTSQSVNDGHSVSYAYDDDGLPISVGRMQVNWGAENGLLGGTTIGIVRDSVSYNGFGEPVGYSVNVGAGSLISQTFSRDKLGRIVSRRESVGDETHVYEYEYDLMGRLIHVNKNGLPAETYVYDANGNRVAVTMDGESHSALYDHHDRLLQYGERLFEYDANGDLVAERNGATGGTTFYDDDVMGNLRGAQVPTGDSLVYLYDARNRLVGKKVNGIFQRGFLYAGGGHLAAELDERGSVRSRFVYAARRTTPDYMIKDGRTYRIVTNHIGSVRFVIDVDSGELVQEIEYDSFGQVLYDTNPGFQPFGFAGGIYDTHTGLVRFGARDYYPLIGRWTTKDPIGFRSGCTNFYEYVHSDPINYYDPDGYSELAFEDSRSGIGRGLLKIIDGANNLLDGISGGIGEALGTIAGGAVVGAAGAAAGVKIGGMTGAIGGMMIGGPAGGAIGGALGEIIGGALGGLIGGYLGGDLGGEAGSLFDPPCAGQLNCEEEVPPICVM